MTKKEINKRLKEIGAEAAELRTLLDAKMRETVLKCAWCKKGTKVSKLTLLQTHWYVSPYSCTGGDYWKRGEVQYDCPKCGKRNRGLEHSWVGCNRKMLELTRYFKETVDVYDD